MDKETAKWVRLMFPKTLHWKLMKMSEAFQNMFYWWK